MFLLKDAILEKKLKVLTVFDDMIAGMISNKKVVYTMGVLKHFAPWDIINK